MKPPLLADDAFLADVNSARMDRESLHVWWVGQSGFLVCWSGRFMLFDPYLSDSLTIKYASTDKPHVRMTGRVVDPARLGFVEVVTSTHNHTDHLDAETLLPMLKANPDLKILVAGANLEFAAQRIGGRRESLRPVDAGATQTVGPFEFHAVPAAHERLDLDSQGRHLYLGYILKLGPWTLYHSGDTVLYPGMVELLRPFGVDVAMLPINGRGPERRVSGNLWGREAARLAADIGARVTIPCHFDMFEFNTALPDEFLNEASLLGIETRVLRQGERSTFPKKP